MHRSALSLLFATAAAVWTPGCLGDRCDPGQILSGGQCVTQATDALPRDAGDSSPAPASDGALEADSSDALIDALAQNLGQECKKSQECDGVASFCVVMPGNTTGYCTIKDCAIAPNDCPEGYTCMDISSYVPDIPNLCIKQ